MGLIYTSLQKINFENVDINDLIRNTEKVMREHEPSKVLADFDSKIPKKYFFVIIFSSLLRSRDVNIFKFYKIAIEKKRKGYKFVSWIVVSIVLATVSAIIYNNNFINLKIRKIFKI